MEKSVDYNKEITNSILEANLYNYADSIMPIIKE